jgi:RNA polymerase sigma-70 factor, ECF subfamily
MALILNRLSKPSCRAHNRQTGNNRSDLKSPGEDRHSRGTPFIRRRHHIAFHIEILPGGRFLFARPGNTVQTRMDLLKAARSGREAAFLQLFDEHHAALFRFAYRLTGSVADAEDIVQECFLELLRPTCAYDAARGPVRAYLFGAVRNQALKRLRKTDIAGGEGSDSRSPESELLLSEMKDAVAAAVMQLPETQREVLILAHYEQMPLAEIAQVMTLEPGAVKSRLQRARASLKETLAAYAPGLERKA